MNDGNAGAPRDGGLALRGRAEATCARLGSRALFSPGTGRLGVFAFVDARATLRMYDADLDLAASLAVRHAHEDPDTHDDLVECDIVRAGRLLGTDDEADWPEIARFLGQRQLVPVTVDGVVGLWLREMGLA